MYRSTERRVFDEAARENATAQTTASARAFFARAERNKKADW
jgi:hypothetical protein